MLWNFAKLMRSPPRAPLSVEDANDAPPEGFVAKVPDEGGDVYVVPMLEALFASLRARRAPVDDASPAPQEERVADRTGAPP